MFKFGLLQSTYGHLEKGSYTTISRHSEPIVGRKCTCASERTTSLDGARPRGPINTRRQTKHRKSTGVFKPSIEPIVYGRGPIVRVCDSRTRRFRAAVTWNSAVPTNTKGCFFGHTERLADHFRNRVNIKSFTAFLCRRHSINVK